MNKVILIGRLTAEPEVTITQRKGDELTIAKYTLAVDRLQNGEKTADFIRCVAFGKLGELADTYLKKGMKIAVVGSIKTGSYTRDDGERVYTQDVIVESQEFVESKKKDEEFVESKKKDDDGEPKRKKEDPKARKTDSKKKKRRRNDDDFMDDDDDDEIPFA